MASVLPLFAWPDGVLDRRKVTQCALSRVCGGCGRPLGRPIAFVGTGAERERNAFHAPPLHQDCAGLLRDRGTAGDVIVLTAGFEYLRPAADDLDPRPRFVPNSIL